MEEPPRPGAPAAGVSGSRERRTEPDTEPFRRCEVCRVKLSAYNPGPNCWQHTMGWPWRGPSAKPRY